MGIGCMTPRFTVVLTHEPSGLEVVRDASRFRTERAAYDSAMRYMRSRLAQMGHNPNDLKLETYTPDDE